MWVLALIRVLIAVSLWANTIDSLSNRWIPIAPEQHILGQSHAEKMDSLNWDTVTHRNTNIPDSIDSILVVDISAAQQRVARIEKMMKSDPVVALGVLDRSIARLHDVH